MHVGEGEKEPLTGPQDSRQAGQAQAHRLGGRSKLQRRPLRQAPDSGGALGRGLRQNGGHIGDLQTLGRRHPAPGTQESFITRDSEVLQTSAL